MMLFPRMYVMHTDPVILCCPSIISPPHTHKHMHTLLPFCFPNTCDILLFLVLLEGEVKDKSWEKHLRCHQVDSLERTRAPPEVTP